MFLALNIFLETQSYTHFFVSRFSDIVINPRKQTLQDGIEWNIMIVYIKFLTYELVIVFNTSLK